MKKDEPKGYSVGRHAHVLMANAKFQLPSKVVMRSAREVTTTVYYWCPCGAIRVGSRDTCAVPQAG